MRREPQKEIDLLLRQLSRRNRIPVAESDEQHLDADELNSYVANALPPAARARYTEHLADCSSCRKLAAQLSVAQGPVVARESASVVAPSGLMSFLASLFTPMVLRYAVPAIGLIVVAVVGIVVLRKDQKDTSVAQVGATNRQSETILSTPTPAQTSTGLSGYSDQSAANDKSSEDAKKETPKPPVVEAPATKAAPAGGRGEANKPILKDGATATANEPAANAEAPPRPSKAVTVEAEAAKRIDELQKEKQQQVADKATTGDVSRNRSDEGAANYQRPPEVAATTAGGANRSDLRRVGPSRGTGRVATAGADRDESRRSREEPKTETFTLAGEARSVGGRRFRKSGSVWIDTAYESSQSTTNVARGSEQYRALVADEPTIRTIAEQLTGEIIVVWKGRAYRIR